MLHFCLSTDAAKCLRKRLAYRNRQPLQRVGAGLARWLGNNRTGYRGNKTGWIFLIFLQYIQSRNLSDIGTVWYENLFYKHLFIADLSVVG
jgi:hypothetical protein